MSDDMSNTEKYNEIQLADGEKGAIIQADRKTYAVAPHIPCGMVTPPLLRKIADAAEKFKVQMKITSACRIALLGLTADEVDQVWEDLGMEPGYATGSRVQSVKVCPGTTWCKRGIKDSMAMASCLDSRYIGKEMPGKVKIGVSGCPNQCAETSIKDIGLIGFKNGWRLVAGGSGGAIPRLAVELARDLNDEEALSLIEKIFSVYKAQGKKKQRIGHFIEKTGRDEVKKLLGLD